MPDSSPAKKKGNFITYTMFFLFIVALLFIYLLGESRRQAEAEFNTRLTATSQNLSQTQKQLTEAQRARDALDADIATLKREQQKQTEDWREKLALAEQAVREGQQRLQTQEAEHAKTLATERNKAQQALQTLQTTHEQAMTAERDRSAQALKAGAEEHRQALKAHTEEHDQILKAHTEQHRQALASAREEAKAALDAEKATVAELQQKLKETDQENTSLKGSIDSLNKTMAWLKEGIATQEKDLREQVETYRIALEGEDPERAFRLSQLEVKVHEAQEALQKARYEWAVKEADYSNRLSAAQQLAQGKVEALNAASRTNVELKDQLSSLQTELATTREQAAIASQEAQAAHTAEVEELSSRLAEAEKLLVATREQSTRDAEAAQAAHAAKSEELNARLTQTNRQLEQVQGQLEQTAKQAQETRTTLQGHIDTLSQNAASQQAEAETTIAGLNERLAGTEEKLAAAERTSADLGTRLQTTEQQAEADRAQMQEAIDSLQQTLAAERAESKSAADAMRSTHEAQVEKLKQQLAAASTQLTQLQDNRQRLQQTLAAEKEQAERARQEGAKALSERNIELQKVQAELADTKQSLHASEADKAAMQQKIQLQEQALAKGQADLEQTLGTLDASRRTLTDLQQLNRGYSKLSARFTDHGMQLTLTEDDLQFARSMATLPAGENESLSKIADFLQQNDGLKVLLRGHTDSTGKKAFNLELSRKRAEAVKEALMEKGIGEARITAEGVGEAEPIATNGYPEGQSKNRRVEVYFTEM